MNTNSDNGQSNTTYYPQEHLSALGCVVVKFSEMEQEVYVQIEKLLGVDEEVAQAITAELSFKGALNLFCTLVRLYKDEDVIATNLKSVVKELTKAEERRNAILHSAWLTDSTDEYITRRKRTAKGALITNYEWVRVDDICDCCDMMDSAIISLRDFVKWYSTLCYHGKFAQQPPI